MYRKRVIFVKTVTKLQTVRAMAQAVSGRPVTPEALACTLLVVRMKFVLDRVALGQVFVVVSCFHLSSFCLVLYLLLSHLGGWTVEFLVTKSTETESHTIAVIKTKV
jgi:hypothetical protein